MTKRAAIVFDMDGLMVDTEPLSRRAWSQLLATYGYELDDRTYGRMIGYRSDVSTQIVMSNYDLPLSAAEIIRRKESIFDSMRSEGVPAMPGLMALQLEIARRALPWGVATSSPRYHALTILKQLSLQDSCRAIAAGDEVANGKPAPDIYLLAARRLGISPDRCLALEDSQPGCAAAAAAGMTVIAIPNGHTAGDGFSMADYVLNSLDDVLENLDELLETS